MTTHIRIMSKLPKNHSLYSATTAKLSLDCHEVKFHAKFNFENAQNQHQHLPNWIEGKMF